MVFTPALMAALVSQRGIIFPLGRFTDSNSFVQLLYDIITKQEGQQCLLNTEK